MAPHQYIVTQRHRSEYPNPITFCEGARLSIGELYRGPEGWDDWHFCTVPGQSGGWVPAQIIGWIDATSGHALQDYTAKELNVDEGERLQGLKTLNGWLWCHRPGSSDAGWVPLMNLRKVQA